MKQDRIEQALRMWELSCLNAKLCIKLVSMMKSGAANDMLIGPIKHSESFRQDILSGKPFDEAKYIQDDISSEAMGVFSYFPAAVHAWTTASRRIYTLGADIQELILQTDVSQLTWKDIVFPFGTFGIALARPIREPGGQLFDFLLVHRGYVHPIKHDGVVIWTISQEFERPMPFTVKEARRAYEDMVLRTNVRKAREMNEFFISKQAVEMTTAGAKLNSLIADGRFFELPLKETFKFVKDNDGKVVSGGLLPGHSLPMSSFNIEVERLVAGLCVYLDMHRRGSKALKVRTDWAPREHPTVDTTCITKEALVCSVQNVYDLSELERELLMIIDPVERDRRCKELGVHYREGYARRRPGFGHDPDAPQCVHVRPAIVGLRRLAPGSLPRGTEKVL